MTIRKERGNQFIRLTFLGQSPWSRLHINKGFMLAKAFGRRQGAPRAISDNSAKSFGALSPPHTERHQAYMFNNGILWLGVSLSLSIPG